MTHIDTNRMPVPFSHTCIMIIYDHNAWIEWLPTSFQLSPKWPQEKLEFKIMGFLGKIAKHGDRIPPPNRRWDPESAASERSWDGSLLKITLCFQNWLKYVKIQGILEHPLFWWQETWHFLENFCYSTAPPGFGMFGPLHQRTADGINGIPHPKDPTTTFEADPFDFRVVWCQCAPRRTEPPGIGWIGDISNLGTFKKNKRVCLVI